MSQEVPAPDTDTSLWLNKEFVTQVLNAYTNNQLENIVEFSKQPATAKGENYFSCLHLLKVSYKLKAKEQDVESTSFIVKSRLENELMSKIEQDFDVFHREAQFYNVIMSEAQELLKCIDDETKFGPSAIYVDERAIVLENLKLKGYAIEDVKQGLNLQQCQLILQKLAKLHAVSMALYKKNPDLFRHNLPGNVSEHPSPLHELYANSIKTCVEICRNTDGLQKYADRLANFGETIIPKMINVFSRNQTDRFHVLNHGDVWVNNILFCKNAQAEIEDVLFVDYQEGFYGSPGIDWNYFIFSSWQNEVFQQHFDSLLMQYHDTLANCLQKFKYEQRIPTIDDVRKEIINKGFHGLTTATCLLPLIINEHEHLMDPETFLPDTAQTNENRRIIFSNEKFLARLHIYLAYFEENNII